MRRTCEKCGGYFDDEIHSTLCPHKGFGFCRACDCMICCCIPPYKPTSQKAGTE